MTVFPTSSQRTPLAIRDPTRPPERFLPDNPLQYNPAYLQYLTERYRHTHLNDPTPVGSWPVVEPDPAFNQYVVVLFQQLAQQQEQQQEEEE